MDFLKKMGGGFKVDLTRIRAVTRMNTIVIVIRI